jgi:hypothetical protein
VLQVLQGLQGLQRLAPHPRRLRPSPDRSA